MTQPGPSVARHSSTADGRERSAPSLRNVIEQFGHVDDPDAYEKAQTTPALAAAMGLAASAQLARQSTHARRHLAGRRR